jgi:hypothetical protein
MLVVLMPPLSSKMRPQALAGAVEEGQTVEEEEEEGASEGSATLSHR